MIFNFIIYIYENILNCYLCYEKDGLILVFLNFKFIFMYIILVLIFLIIFIVVLVILLLFYCKLKMFFRINFFDFMYYKNKNEVFKCEIMFINIINDIDMNCCLYEVIIIDLDDLELNECKIVVINY